MAAPHRVRTVVTWVNGTTLLGLALAALARTTRVRTPGGVIVAGGYRLPVPRQKCFTVGSVILTRRPAEWLLHPDRTDLFDHETGHIAQYAALGPLFLPAYWAMCGYSYVLTGSYGSRNVFERRAGLLAGGYRELPLRPWATRLAAAFRQPVTAGPISIRNQGFGTSSADQCPDGADTTGPSGVGQSSG